jgi:hypothetical protein
LLETAARVAKALGVSIDELAFEVPNPPSQKPKKPSARSR